MKNKGLIIIGITVALAIGAIVYLTTRNIQFAQKQFTSDGYIIAPAESAEGETVNNKQYFFNEGDIYLTKKDDTIAFKTVEGDNATIGKDNFIHYTDTSMTSMAKSVILDADSIHENQIVYYTLAKGSEVEKRNQGYAVYNGDELLNLQNFIWKLSANRYMLVSPEIELVVDEDSSQKFDDFIQIDYKDGGVVDLVNQDGTYRTISSDAYLEMTNSVRVYLGSKNISDSKGILMNMGQMLVNSSDDVELSPDIAFTNENDDQPRITVEATDGRDGADGEDGAEGKAGQAGQAGQAGESGESGENGENGENGEKGAQGAAGSGGGGGGGGTPGNNAKNAGIQFAEETMPLFTIDGKMNISTNGMSAKLKLDRNECEVNDGETYITIVESATGKEVWKYTPAELIDSGFVIECRDALKPDTNYTLAVTSKYTPKATGEAVTSTVMSKYFTTMAEGLSLTVKYAAEGYIIADLAKTSENTINNVLLEIFDSDMNPMDRIYYGEPTSATISQEYYHSDTHSIDVFDMNVGDHYEVQFIPLDCNSLYYLHIFDTAQSVESNEYFPYVKAKTLKTPPTLDRPRVDLVERDNAFVVTPVGIQDPDGGIVSYTYEIYKKSAVDMSGKTPSFEGKPEFTSQKSTAVDLTVPIDGVRIKRTTEDPDAIYVCRILANFDNNETMVVYSSPLSNEFSAGESVWPTVINKLDEDYLTASTAQGILIIDDPHHTITISDAFRVKLTCKASGDIDSREIVIPVSKTDLENGYKDDKGHYELPYFLSGLKDNNQYTIYATADYITIEGSMHKNALIGSDAFNTKGPNVDRHIVQGGYDPLLLKYTENSADITHAFAVFAGFTSFLSQEEESARRELKTNSISTTQGLKDMGDFTGKSLGYIEFTLWGSDSKGEIPVQKLGTALHVTDRDAKSATEGFNFGENINSMYNKYYTSTLSEPYYSSSSDGHYINLTEDSFNVSTDIAKQFKKLFIKAVAYDYCYGDGGQEKKTFGENNFIQIGNTTEYKTGSDMDPYIEFEPRTPLPGIPPEKDFEYENVTRGYVTDTKGGTVTAPDVTYHGMRSNNEDARFKYLASPSEGIEYVTYLSNINDSNKYDKLAKLEAEWNGVKSETLAGYKIKGYSNFADFGDAIKYTIYRDEDLKEEITSSGWLKYNKESTKHNCPEWTFFFDVDDVKTEESISRGEPFWVKTEIHLINSYADKSIFPTEFEGSVLPAGSVIKKKLVGYKQIPDVYMAQKNAVVTASGSEGSYYFEYDDIDNALLYKDDTVGWNNILFYIASDLYSPDLKTPANVQLKQTGKTRRDDMRYYIDSLNLEREKDTDGNVQYDTLYVRYDLNPTESGDKDSKKVIPLVNEKYVIPKQSDYFRTLLSEFTADVSEEIDEEWIRRRIDGGDGYSVATVSEEAGTGKIDFKFRFFADNSVTSDVESMCGPLSIYLYDLDDVNPDGTPTGEPKYKKENIKKNGTTGYRIIPYGQMYDHVYAYEAVVGIDIAELYRFAEEKDFYCKVFWSYDGGNYGTDYVREYSRPAHVGGYALQTNTSGYVFNTLEDSIIDKATPSDFVTFEAEPDSSWPSLTSSRNAYFKEMGNRQGLPAAAAVTAFGLDYIPRQVLIKDINIQLELDKVLPYISGTITPGMTSAKFVLNIGASNTLAQEGNNLQMYYRKHSDDPDNPDKYPWCASPSEWHVKPHQEVVLDPAVTLTGLEKATWYDVCYYVKTQDSKGNWIPVTEDRVLDTIELFQTRADTSKHIDDFWFEADNTGRDDKHAYVTSTIGEILWSDLNDSVDNVTVRIKVPDATEPGGVRILDTEPYTKQKLLDLFERQNPHKDVGYISLTTDFPWEPLNDIGASADGHVMNGIREYTAEVSLNLITEQDKNPVKMTNTPDTWKGQGSYQTVRGYYESIETNPKVVKISANVTATDPLRVFDVVESVPASVSETGYAVKTTLTLWEQRKNTATGEIEIVPVDGQVPKEAYLPYHYDNGLVDPSDTITWDRVQAGKTYLVLSTMNADFDNNAVWEPYEVYGGLIVTPDPQQDAFIAYITLEPGGAVGTANLFGLRLGPANVKKLRYHIYTTGSSEELDKVIELTGVDLERFYHPQGSTEGYYKLDVPLMDDPMQNYVLDVELFKNEGDTIPVTANTGTWRATTVTDTILNMVRSIFR